MRCPFLKETRVRSCEVLPHSAMIVQESECVEDEKCLTSRYSECRLANQRLGDLAGEVPASRCPFLKDSLVQYCAASAVRRYVPYSESLLTRCGNDGYRYCGEYRALAEPPGTTGSNPSSAPRQSLATSVEPHVDGICVPSRLWYAPNHMWLDYTNEGICHVGFDAFFVAVIGSIDHLSFVTMNGESCPTVVITVRGVNFQMIFPCVMTVTATNVVLRMELQRLLTDPYVGGWLFEGVTHPERQHLGAFKTGGLGATGRAAFPVPLGLTRGHDALPWMQKEIARLSHFIHTRASRPDPATGVRTVLDGGRFADRLCEQLSREDISQVFNEFFSPYASWRSLSE
jgi:glycine cleavage system H lipoate-binding protein